MSQFSTITVRVIAGALALFVALQALVYGSVVVESLEDLYGVYRTADGKVATINPYPMAYFYYRDTAGRCIDFWPIAKPSPPVIAAGQACRARQREITWSATRNPDGSIALLNRNGEFISLRRQAVRGQTTDRGLHYDLPSEKSSG